MIIVMTVSPTICLFCIYELWRSEMKMGYGEFTRWLLREGLTKEHLMSMWREHKEKKRRAKMLKAKPHLNPL